MFRGIKKPHYAWLILIGVCFMQAGGLGAVLDAAGVFMVPVCDDLGFSRSELSMYLTCYFIATIVAMPFVGKWIGRFDFNRLLSGAVAIVVVALGLMGTYTESWQWWISGILFGLAGSFVFVVPGPVLIQNWFYKRRGIAMGVGMSFSGIGGAIASPLFTLFIQSMGWREAYVLAAIVIAAMVLPWTLFVFKLKPEDKGMHPYGWEEPSASSVVIAPNAHPVNTSPATPHAKSQFLHSAGSGVPISKAALLSAPFICMFLVAGFISYFAGFNSQMSGFAQSIGYDAMTASTLLSAIMAGNVVEKLLIGWLNDKIGVEKTVNIQLALVALGLLGFALFSQSNPIVLYISAFMFGAQNSLYSVSLPLVVRQIFGERDYTRFFAYSRIGTGAIGCLGPITIAGIYDITGAYSAAFAVGTLVCVASFVTFRIACVTKKNLNWVENGAPTLQADGIGAAHGSVGLKHYSA